MITVDDMKMILRVIVPPIKEKFAAIKEPINARLDSLEEGKAKVIAALRTDVEKLKQANSSLRKHSESLERRYGALANGKRDESL